MRQTEIENQKVFSLISAKLQKDYDKLLKRIPNREENTQKIMDALTIGTEKNEKVFGTSLVAPVVPLAVGIGKALVGTVALVPSMISGAPNAESIPFFEKVSEFGKNMLNSSQDSISKMVPLLVLPATVAAISISMKIYDNIIKNRKNKLYETNAIVNLIDDIIERKEDPTLDFAYRFVKRVDLSKIDSKINLELLKYLTYYRYMLQKQEKNEVTNKEVEEAFDSMIQYFKYLKEREDCSLEFKNNRFINVLINEYDEKIRVENILSGIPVR